MREIEKCSLEKKSRIFLLFSGADWANLFFSFNGATGQSDVARLQPDFNQIIQKKTLSDILESLDRDFSKIADREEPPERNRFLSATVLNSYWFKYIADVSFSFSEMLILMVGMLFASWNLEGLFPLVIFIYFELNMVCIIPLILL